MGKYKNLSGSVPCDLCDSGFYSDSRGMSTCASCPAGSSSPPGTASLYECACTPGFTGANGAMCFSCMSGKYKAAPGTDSCTSCEVGKYSTSSGMSACTSCPQGTYKSKVGAGTCTTCPAGSSTRAVASTVLTNCTGCVGGTYRGSVDIGACSSCPVGSWSPERSVVATDCVCTPGYTGPNGVDCLKCEPGTYKPSSGSSSCTACPSPHSISTAGSNATSDCKCQPGYTGSDGGTCVACAMGTYKLVRGSSNCTACEAGKYKNVTGTGECAACPPLATSPSGSDELNDCRCLPGSFGPNGDKCNACPSGTFKDSPGSHACTQCPMHTNSTAGGADVTDCHCVGGLIGPGGGPCTACPAGKFKTGSTECTDCPYGSFSPEAANRIQACTCKKGYAAAADGTACVACDTRSFKNVAGIGNCSACPSNTVASEGSMDRADCKCRAGFTGKDGGDCIICPAGKYKTDPGSEACTSCPAEPSWSSAGSTIVTDCKCNVGFVGPDGATVCEPCDVGSYKNMSGDSNCSLPEMRMGACGLYCWTLPYRAMWYNGNYTVDASAEAVLQCNSTCGDGMRAGLEECDDGNTKDGDGCSAQCTLEEVLDQNSTQKALWECVAQDSTLPVNESSNPVNASASSTEASNSSSVARRAQDPICYRDICKRTALFVKVQSAKETATAVGAVMGTVVVAAATTAVAGGIAGAVGGGGAAAMGGAAGGGAAGGAGGGASGASAGPGPVFTMVLKYSPNALRVSLQTTTCVRMRIIVAVSRHGFVMDNTLTRAWP